MVSWTKAQGQLQLPLQNEVLLNPVHLNSEVFFMQRVPVS